MSTLDPKQLENLMASDVFRQAQAAADAQRVEAHQAAVDALLEHESDIAELTSAQDATEAARRELLPAESAYLAARRKHAAAVAVEMRIAACRENRANALRAEAVKHTPDILRRFDAALYLARSIILSAFTSREHYQPTMFGGFRTTITDNSRDVDAALDQVETCRELVAELEIQPMPGDEIHKLLNAESAKLVNLAKEAGVSLIFWLPEELRQGALAEKPERQGPYIFPR